MTRKCDTSKFEEGEFKKKTTMTKQRTSANAL